MGQEATFRTLQSSLRLLSRPISRRPTPVAATQDTRLSDAGRYTRGNRGIDRLNASDSSGVKARPHWDPRSFGLGARLR